MKENLDNFYNTNLEYVLGYYYTQEKNMCNEAAHEDPYLFKFVLIHPELCNEVLQ